MGRYLSPKEKRIKREQDTARQTCYHDYMSHIKPDERAKKNFRRKPYHVEED